ncbi:MAG: GGDEF domain-containing protein [Luteimonas sp.]
MRNLRGNVHERLFAAGMAWLLVLFAAGVIAATRHVADQVPVRLQAGAGNAPLSNDGGALLLTGGVAREAVVLARFNLPPPDPAQSRWVVWLGRDPVDAVWLEGAGWTSARRDFFRPAADEGVLPSGFLLPLPATWQGDIALSLHAQGSVRSALRPRVLREAAAMQLAHRAIALNCMIYAGMFVLALLALALYSAARERSFLALFGCACAALLLLAAENGHLYLLPGFGLLAGWRGAGLWALGLLFCAAALQMLLRYADLRDGITPAARLFDGYCIALVALAALCLLDLRALDPWLQSLVMLAWFGTGVGAIVVLVDAVRRRVPMAWSILLLVLLTAAAALVRAALSHGYLVDMLWTRHGYQFALVVTTAVLMVGLIGRIGEFRDQRDRDRLARVDSERRMGRESARAELTLALQTRLRALEATDIEWTAFRLLLEHLLPQMPVESAAVVAYGYHGHDLLVVEPAERKQAVHDDVAARCLPLKRLALQSMSLQQPGANAGSAYTEALLPLPIHAPGWGLLLLRRAGSDGFSTEEMALASEFARLSTLHADEALAAFQLQRSAELDALTGAFNRRSIDQWLARAFLDAHRQQQALSLLFIDIDHFKGINDRRGHAGGDHCLRQVAAALRGALDAGDMLGRYGGEEFVALLPGRGGAEAREMGERVRAGVERCEIEYEGGAEHLTVSVGVATRLDRESTPAAAIERADKALYAAKRGGRNCVHVAPAVFT